MRRPDKELAGAASSEGPELLSTGSQFRQVLAAARVGAWQWDLKTNQTLWSAENYELLGYEPGGGRAAYEDWLARVHPDDRGLAELNVNRAIEERGDLDFEYRVVWPDGSTHWLRDIGKMILGENGEPIGMFGVHIDVTKRHALEEALQKAQRAEVTSRVAGAVAHNFNNLLTVISGYCGLLGERLDDDPAALQLLAKVNDSADQAAELTKQLLAFGQRQVFRTEVLDLNDFIGQHEGLIRSSLGGSISVELDLDPLLERVRIDPTQIEHALLQLAINSRDAMPNGGKVLLATRNLVLAESELPDGCPLDPGPHVVISLQDSGSRSNAGALSPDFDPFANPESRLTGPEMGLASARGIIEQSGGWLRVTGRSEGGTLLEIFLPRTAEDPDAGDRRSRRGPASSRPLVLFVEDDRVIRSLFEVYLQNKEIDVVAAATAEAALEVFAEAGSSVDLLITDIVLPGSSGPELAKAIRASHPDLPVLFISGYGRDRIGDLRALGPGVSLLHKPFSPAELLNRVQQALAPE